ncbi:uncharacterized protein MONOS_9772 [Monocercomonoides exilis]|uniref:uncharacterized protein n=1 Tax=Monocercomonoides exilis TaxID=2049356 RepID=UPI003559C1EF|nr:hypothetical protein MONOS_9772 [Monocercomonoides exilis]|eukprot:MONOS_9772.1-p1 / transcript=MONOS_9772.1 / gene=MONOS_9772 / organism=Monocercomonoides_exilis_PA203 / gene_product=unspecified product / transcript_product=unspecified product / location=Mono_scaffold00416:31330-32442(-) / protein_length=371 / sequence_SO=supercontig / SO=protein_coding / is_pseudo=false
MSEEEGGMKVCLKRGESKVRVVGCSLGMCSCSSVKVRGGGMMVEALDPNEGGTSALGPVGIKMENVRFLGNEAFVEKDVFIKCHSIGKQINKTMFVLDFEQDALKGKNSMCGSDGEGKVDVDLIPLITFFHSAQVFVSVNENDSRQCGAQNYPCQSISCGFKHIERSVANMILIHGECMICGWCEIGDLNVKSVKKAKSTIHFEGKMGDRGEERSMMVFVNECVVERCKFVFGEAFEGVEESVGKDLISSRENDVEVSELNLFRNEEFPSSAQPFVMKNTSETKGNGNEIMSKGEDKFEWSLFAFIECIVIGVILLVVIVAVFVLMRKKLREAEKRVEKERFENEQIMGKIERRRRKKNLRISQCILKQA